MTADQETRPVWPEAPGIPIVIGVTGHRDPKCAPTLRRSAENLFRSLQSALSETNGAPLILACGLAEGADHIAAEARGNMPLIAISPMPLNDYRATFSTAAGLAKFDELWLTADLQIELPWIGTARDETGHVAQFEQLGWVLSRYAHLLVAFWDGEVVSTPKPGGTAHVVAARRATEMARLPVTGDQRGLQRLRALLELSPTGPVIQVATPRQSTGGRLLAMTHSPVEGIQEDLSDSAPPASVAPGDIWFWSDAERAKGYGRTGKAFRITLGAESGRSQGWTSILRRRIDSARGISLSSDLATQLPPDFGKFHAVTSDLRRAFEAYPELCRLHEVYLRPDGAETLPPLALLGRLQARIDVAASGYQRRLVGDWSPGLPWAEASKLAASRGKKRPAFGALSWFAVAVPLGAIFYEGYAHLEWGWVGVFAYLLTVGGTAAYYRLVVRRQAWQGRFEDYRALAEALRVQFHWAACGLADAASDNYLRQHADELGWVRQALRGPALLGMAAARAANPVSPERELDHWIDYQSRFFVGPDGKSGRAAVNETAQRRVKTTVRCLLWLFGVLATGMVIVDLWVLLSPESYLHKILVIALALLPALAVLPLVVSEGRVYEAHSHAYRRAGRLYRLVAAILEQRRADGNHETSDLAVELGREALIENAAWFVSHRERRVANRSG
jgi:hypothetical protein